MMYRLLMLPRLLSLGIFCYLITHGASQDQGELFGPQAGGTQIVLQGDLSFVTGLNLTCNGTEYVAELRTSGDAHHAYVTPNVSDDHVGVTCDIIRVTNESVGDILGPFTYKPNPVVQDIQPDKTILSGGIMFTVTGTHLDSVVQPELRVFFEVDDKVYDQPGSNGYRDAEERRADICTKVNSTLMYCPSKTVKDHGNRQFRTDPQTGSLNSIHIQFFVGVILDGLTNYRNFSKLGMYPDPDFTRFTEDPLPFKIYKGENTIEIYGNYFLHGFQRKDLDITVGQGVCEVEGEILTNHFNCRPPDEKPEHREHFEYADNPRVWAEVARSGPFDLGELRYETTFWDDSQTRLAIITSVTLVVVLIIIITVALVCVCRKRRQRREEDRRLVDNEYTRAPDLWQRVPRDIQEQLEPCLKDAERLRLGAELSHGNFGAVHAGKFLGDNDTTVLVAAKTIKDTGVTPEELRAFLEEPIIMKNLDHENVLKLLGVIFKEGRPYVLLPFMENGSLKDFLVNKNNAFTVSDLLEYALQVANGMSYIAKSGTVHRDLAARNCLVSKDNVVKVSDFGLARFLDDADYYKLASAAVALPIWWMAPESMETMKFTVMSDVWSFGVFLWELMTRCRRPYAHVDRFDLKRFLKTGRRLDRPAACPENIYSDVMIKCWAQVPQNRLSFDEIAVYLRGLLSAASQTEANHNTVACTSPAGVDPEVTKLYQNLSRYVDTEPSYTRISQAVDHNPPDEQPDNNPTQDGYLAMGGLDYTGAAAKFAEVEEPEVPDGYLKPVSSGLFTPQPDYLNQASQDSGYLIAQDIQHRPSTGSAHRPSAGNIRALPPSGSRRAEGDGSYLNVGYRRDSGASGRLGREEGDVVIRMTNGK